MKKKLAVKFAALTVAVTNVFAEPRFNVPNSLLLWGEPKPLIKKKK